MYTVVAPPAEYKTGAEGSVTLSQPACINTVEDPAGKRAIILHLWTVVTEMCHKAGDLLEGALLSSSVQLSVTITLLYCLFQSSCGGIKAGTNIFIQDLS